MKKSQQSSLRLLAATTLVIIASAGTAVTAQASYIVNATEVGGNVVFAGAGSLDLTAWTYQGGTNSQAGVKADEVVVIGALSTIDIYYQPTNYAGPTSIGPGTGFFGTTAGTGDMAGIRFDIDNLLVTTGYTSGAALSGAFTLTSSTFASLGLTPGSYEWTWGSGASADSFTLNVGAVPVPAAVWLFGSGLLGLVGIARRKARA